MNILIADDDPVSLKLLETTLGKWEHNLILARDGAEAWDVLKRADAPPLAILDWMMPRIEGVEVCRQVRNLDRPERPYIIMVTAKVAIEDMVEGLDAGADDYITKPFDRAELRARIRVGERIIALQSELAGRVADLEESLAQVNLLNGMLPICSYCKKIRDDRDYWQEVDEYMMKHSGAEFTHGVCPDCYAKYAAPATESPLY